MGSRRVLPPSFASGFDPVHGRSVAVAVALLPKSGSEWRSTGLEYFGQYLDDAGLSKFVPSEMDPLEQPALGGRLLEFLNWIVFRRPHLHATSLGNYISEVREHYAVSVGYRMIYSPLFSQYLKRLRQIPQEAHYKEAASKQLIALVFADESIDIAVRTSILVGWEGLLRCGEYCSRAATSHNPLSTLVTSAVRRDPSLAAGNGGYRIRLIHSKGDEYNIGDEAIIPYRSGDSHCAALAIDRYLALHRSSGDEPFFRKVMRGGRMSNVTRLDVAKALKKHARAAGMDPARISTHSIRIGAAFALRTNGIEWGEILKKGRWSTASGNKMAMLYSRLSAEHAVQMTNALNIDARRNTEVPV